MTCSRWPEEPTSSPTEAAVRAIEPESILARAPEVIIELHYGPLQTDRCMRSARLECAPLSYRRQDNRVHVLVGDEFVVPGPASCLRLTASRCASSGRVPRVI